MSLGERFGFLMANGAKNEEKKKGEEVNLNRLVGRAITARLRGKKTTPGRRRREGEGGRGG